MISLSTKLLTVDRISCWMSVRSAVCAKRVNGLLLRDSGVRITREYGPPPAPLRRVPPHAARGRVVEYPPTGAAGQEERMSSDETAYRGDPPSAVSPQYP